MILWDAVSYQRLATLIGHTNWVRSVAFSPDGQLLATCGDDTTIRLWDVSTGRPKTAMFGHTNQVVSIVFGQSGKMLASTSLDETVRLWDITTGKVKAILSDVNSVSAVAVAPDGSIVASANHDGQIKLWDLVTGELIRTIAGDADRLRCVAFTPDSQTVVAAGDGQVVRAWDVATGQELLALYGHQAPINALAFSPDGTILASCDHEGQALARRASQGATRAMMGCLPTCSWVLGLRVVLDHVTRGAGTENINAVEAVIRDQVAADHIAARPIDNGHSVGVVAQRLGACRIRADVVAGDGINEAAVADRDPISAVGRDDVSSRGCGAAHRVAVSSVLQHHACAVAPRYVTASRHADVVAADYVV